MHSFAGFFSGFQPIKPHNDCYLRQMWSICTFWTRSFDQQAFCAETRYFIGRIRMDVMRHVRSYFSQLHVQKCKKFKNKASEAKACSHTGQTIQKSGTSHSFTQRLYRTLACSHEIIAIYCVYVVVFNQHSLCVA